MSACGLACHSASANWAAPGVDADRAFFVGTFSYILRRAPLPSWIRALCRPKLASHRVFCGPRSAHRPLGSHGTVCALNRVASFAGKFFAPQANGAMDLAHVACGFRYRRAGVRNVVSLGPALAVKTRVAGGAKAECGSRGAACFSKRVTRLAEAWLPQSTCASLRCIIPAGREGTGVCPMPLRPGGVPPNRWLSLEMSQEIQ